MIVTTTARQDYTSEQVEALEGEMLALPQVDIPTSHTFAGGVYARGIKAPAGSFIIGHRHKNKHINFLMSGRLSVMLEGKVHQITAPDMMVVEADTRKVMYIHEATHWVTVHQSHNETDPDVLENILIVKSDTFQFIKDNSELKALQEAVAGEGAK